MKVEEGEKSAVRIKRERDVEVDDILASGVGKKARLTTTYKTRSIEVVDLDEEIAVDAITVDDAPVGPISID